MPTTHHGNHNGGNKNKIFYTISKKNNNKTLIDVNIKKLNSLQYHKDED